MLPPVFPQRSTHGSTTAEIAAPAVALRATGGAAGRLRRIGHRLGESASHLCDCLPGRQRHRTAPPRRSDFALPVLSPRPHPPTQPKLQLRPLLHHPRGAQYRLQPPGFDEHDSLEAFSWPVSRERAPSYHECLQQAGSGVPMLNMLCMALSGNDPRCLTRASEFEGFVYDRLGSPGLRQSHHMDDLRDFHNQQHADLPRLALARLSLHAGTGPTWECGRTTTDAQQEARAVSTAVESALIIGMSLHQAGGRGTAQPVLIRRLSRERFQMLDPGRRQPFYVYANSMASAITAFARQLGLNPAEGRPLRCALLYALPTPASTRSARSDASTPAPRPVAPVVWL